MLPLILNTAEITSAYNIRLKRTFDLNPTIEISILTSKSSLRLRILYFMYSLYRIMHILYGIAVKCESAYVETRTFHHGIIQMGNLKYLSAFLNRL